MLDKYVRSSKIFLKANPDYRKEVWDFKAGSDPVDKEIVARMKGKQIPAIGNVEISIVEETQARMLAFENGETDLEYQLWDVSSRFMSDDNKLLPAFANKGVRLDRIVDAEITYTYMNTLDKIGDQPNPVGGFSKERIALRRAIAMAYNLADQIKIIRKNQAVKAEYPIPPGVTGHEPAWKNSARYDPPSANSLLDRFGYKKGGDGYRNQPDGKPLVIRYSTTPDERGRLLAELMKKSMDSIAVKVDIHIDKFPELLKAEKQCRLMVRGAAWIADYPDGDNFMQLLYGPNAYQSNNACYKSAEYDKLYEKSKLMPDSPERNKLYREMTKIMERDTPWIMNDSRYRNTLLHPQVARLQETSHPACGLGLYRPGKEGEVEAPPLARSATGGTMSTMNRSHPLRSRNKKEPPMFQATTTALATAATIAPGLSNALRAFSVGLALAAGSLGHAAPPQHPAMPLYTAAEIPAVCDAGLARARQAVKELEALPVAQGQREIGLSCAQPHADCRGRRRRARLPALQCVARQGGARCGRRVPAQVQ